jgi:hypothetical protein
MIQTAMETPPMVTVDSQTRRKIPCRQELVITSLQRFYSTRTDLQEIVELLKGTSDISLRLIDWFVTNYSKAHSTSYILKGQEFVVYTDYKNQLKAYSKKLFDPFCRRERISFQVPGHESFLTTVGKLNFFRWAIEKDILNFIKGHKPTIEKEMNVAMRDLNKNRNVSVSTTTTTSTLPSIITTTTDSSTRKRQTHTRDTTTPVKILQKHDCEIEMRFD